MIYLIVISGMLLALWFLIHLHNKRKNQIQNMSDVELFEPVRTIVGTRTDSENFIQSFQPSFPQRIEQRPNRFPPSPPIRQPQRSSIGSSSSFKSDDDSYRRKSYDSSDDYSSSIGFNSWSDSSSCSDSSSSSSCDSSSSDSGSCSCSD